MREYSDIVIHRAIVHVVAPKQNRLHTSTAELQLTTEMKDFLAAHVERGLADRKAVAAAFRGDTAGTVAFTARQIVGGGTKFVERSTSLAKALFDASQTPEGVDARVSDGTLVIARCKATDRAASAPFVAMLKLDPNDAWRAVTKTVKGKEVVRLELEPNVLPTPRERVQKAAFVRGGGHEFDLLMVDRQRRGETISEFFSLRFLDAMAVLDPKQRTERLYRALVRARDELAPQLDRQEYQRLDQYVNGAVVGGRVNVDQLVESLPLDDERQKERVAATIAAELPDREFETDGDTARRLVARRRFRADNGLTVSVGAEFYDNMVSPTPPADADGEWQITIRTRTWQEQ